MYPIERLGLERERNPEFEMIMYQSRIRIEKYRKFRQEMEGKGLDYVQGYVQSGTESRSTVLHRFFIGPLETTLEFLGLSEGWNKGKYEIAKNLLNEMVEKREKS